MPGPDSVPCLKLYGFSATTGFLPDPPPIQKLPDYFEPWETILRNLHALMLSGKLRTQINNLKLLNIESLDTIALQRRAFVILSFLAHSYLIGIPKFDVMESVIPSQIAIPWYEIANVLQVKPEVSYVGVDLWNWYLVDPELPVELDNMAMGHTFTGSFDEAWFFLVPLGVEAAGAPALQAILDCQSAILKFDDNTVVESLKIAKSCIGNMEKVIARMYEKNDPHIFWNRVRPYQSGSKNNANYPNGVFYEGVTNIDEFCCDFPSPQNMKGTWRKYAGASAGQSPLIHFLDIAFGIEHGPMHHVSTPTAGEQPKKELSSTNPMHEMRQYLPLPCQQFLKALAKAPSIRNYVLNSTSAPLQTIFNDCILGLKKFRDTHIKLTTVYIISQQNKELHSKKSVGTGGTELIPFLKQVRTETMESWIGEKETSPITPAVSLS